jgi:O-antigen/teichoic acid export membrane protein
VPATALTTLLLGVSLLPLAPSVVWEGTLLRDGRADAEARAVIAAEIVHLALAALLLAAGLGLLALALARVARALTAFVTLGRATGWPLALSTDWPHARALLPVSAHVTLASLISFATTYGVDLIVGLFLGPAAVAFYRIGSRIAGGVADVLNETVRVLGWSTLPTPRPGETPAGRAARIDAFFGRVVELTAPVFTGLALVAAPLVLLLLGDGWQPAAFVTALMSLARMLQTPATVAWPALASVGATGRIPRLALALSGSALALTVALGPFGLHAIVWGQVLAALIGGGATVLLVNRAAMAGARLSLRPDLLLGLAFLAAAVLALREAPLPLALSLSAQVAAGAAAYAGFLRWRRPALWAEITAALRPATPASEAPR